jgi:hypothetical protein
VVVAVVVATVIAVKHVFLIQQESCVGSHRGVVAVGRCDPAPLELFRLVRDDQTITATLTSAATITTRFLLEDVRKQHGCLYIALLCGTTTTTTGLLLLRAGEKEWLPR